MKTLIIYNSIHNNNTKKVAETIAKSLNADIFKVDEIRDLDISDYDLVGLGSGIYKSNFHKSVIDLIDKLGDLENKRFFLFSTSGSGDSLFNNFNQKIKDRILGTGGRIVGVFNCRGFDNWGLFKIIGGLNKNRPNEEDLIRAKEFANSLSPKLQTLCIAADNGRVLLGMKKRGFGEGRWNGFGGKVENGEGVVEAAKRELFEEAMIEAQHLEEIGTAYFDFLDTNKHFKVHIFNVSAFVGEPKETEEMRPQWFYLDEIPFETMWPDDVYWMPLFLQKRKFKGRFLFKNNQTVLNHNITLD